MSLPVGPGRPARGWEEKVRLQKESPIMDTVGNKELDPKSLAGKQNPIQLAEILLLIPPSA